eukprot:TRINITY_DN20986_c0_g1_i1.p1 TRINITY_DN20986_c0_g1~~TRINITY_DN20986_c0_g1_i1.p1  ORF type:complete len:371 (+),score=82.57 TRINITY_DN20986_c0_g1_i1:83-1195(+)
MGKKKATAEKVGRGSNQAGLVPMDVTEVRFTHSRIRPQFSCGRKVMDTLASIESGEITIKDLPPITLVSSAGGGAPYFSLNNRRLFVLKELRAKGIISEVNVRIKPPLDSKRERDRYTADKCSLTAKLMGIKEAEEAESKENDEDNVPKETSKPDTTGATPTDTFPRGWSFSKGDVTVYDIDANSLRPKKWIRDPVISFFLDVLKGRSAMAGTPICFLDPPISMLIANQPDTTSAMAILGEATASQIANNDTTIIAIVNNSSSLECATSGSHWSVLSRTHGKWLAMDSCGKSNDSHAQKLANILSNTTVDMVYPDVPQQGNHYDCGVHAMINAAALAGVPSIPTETDEMRTHVKDLLWNLSKMQSMNDEF